MNLRLPSIVIGSLLLAACVPNNGSINQQMGGMNHGQMQQGATTGTSFLPAQGIAIASLPEAIPSETMTIVDGQSVTLNPTIVRKNINGKEIAMYGYNGQIPGPILKVQQGSTFTVNVTNNIDMPTSVHWHGLRLDNASDGTVGVTQDAIPQGGSYSYTVKVPDEGIFWYHPHVREDIQQDMGLYGLIHVLPNNPDAYPKVDREEYVILDDILLDDTNSPVPYGRTMADHSLMGRFGNVFLLNGSEKKTTDIALGSVVRYYILNTSNARTYRVIAPPDGGSMKVVGGDIGRLEKASLQKEAIISPAERLIVDMNFLNTGVNAGTPASATVPMVTTGPADRQIPVLSAIITGGIHTPDAAFSKTPAQTDVAADINTFRPFFGKAVDHTLVLDLSMMGNTAMGGHGMMDSTGSPQVGDIPADGIEWEDTMGMMNTGMMGNMMQWKLIDEATGAANEKIVYNAKVGDKLKIRIINKKDSAHPMQHPIHFHGQRFLVLSDNGIENKNLVWKDTTLVPAGHTVDILLDITNPGDWMFHCHIAEHLSNGMMGMLKVE